MKEKSNRLGLLFSLLLIAGLVVSVRLVQERQLINKKAQTTPSSSTLYFIHSDHLGSTNLVTDAGGTVVSQQAYYPYGETKASEGDSPTERQYTGQISDQEETGLYYYHARYYNPATAQFTQADSAGGGLNRYAYVGGNPIVFSDPSGNMALHPGETYEEYYGGYRQQGRDDLIPNLDYTHTEFRLMRVRAISEAGDKWNQWNSIQKINYFSSWMHKNIQYYPQLLIYSQAADLEKLTNSSFSLDDDESRAMSNLRNSQKYIDALKKSLAEAGLLHNQKSYLGASGYFGYIVFAKKQFVCLNYAQLLSEWINSELEIPAITVGYANYSLTQGHAWTVFDFQDKTYIVNPTAGGKVYPIESYFKYNLEFTFFRRFNWEIPLNIYSFNPPGNFLSNFEEKLKNVPR